MGGSLLVAWVSPSVREGRKTRTVAAPLRGSPDLTQVLTNAPTDSRYADVPLCSAQRSCLARLQLSEG